jgi:hypothetical protein
MTGHGKEVTERDQEKPMQALLQIKIPVREQASYPWVISEKFQNLHRSSSSLGKLSLRKMMGLQLSANHN